MEPQVSDEGNYSFPLRLGFFCGRQVGRCGVFTSEPNSKLSSQAQGNTDREVEELVKRQKEFK